MGKGKGSAATRSQFNEHLMRNYGMESSASAGTPASGMILNTPPKGGGASFEEVVDRENKAKAATPVLAGASVHPAVEPGAPLAQSALRELPLKLLMDSPYQPRLHYDDEYIQELAGSIAAMGLIEPIKVRPVDDKFEIIQGHCRKRAVERNGTTTVIKCVVEHQLSDVDAKKAALVGNESRKQLTEYERARSFKRALDEKLASSQTEVALLFGCSQARVSQALTLMQLPQIYHQLLKKHPGLFGYRTARDLLDLHAKHPEQADLIYLYTEKLIEENEPGRLVDWVEEALRKQQPLQPRPPRNEGLSVTYPSGRIAYKTRLSGKKLVVDVKCDVDPEEVQRWVLELLKTKAQEQQGEAEADSSIS